MSSNCTLKFSNVNVDFTNPYFFMYKVLLHNTLIIETLASSFLVLTFQLLFYVTGCHVYTYGPDCIYCGNCSGGVQCNHVTGTCPKGCDSGIYGEKCDLGNVKIKFSFSKMISAFYVNLCCFQRYVSFE